MLKTARFAPLLLAAWVAPAVAADCLQQIDNITVEFDLPAAQSIAGSQTAPPSSPGGRPAIPPPPTMTPPGRPGALHGIGGGPITSAPLLPHERLTAAQRATLQSILQQARSVEALGNELKCFDLLREAEAITKSQG